MDGLVFEVVTKRAREFIDRLFVEWSTGYRYEVIEGWAMKSWMKAAFDP